MNLYGNFFLKQKFEPKELDKYKKAAKQDLDIARSAEESKVKFHFAYMALIKIGIYYIAQAGYRVKSRPGHHQRIIEYLGKILDNEDIIVVGDKMRKERNLDFYSADFFDSPEEIGEYLKFIEAIYRKI